MPPDPAHPTPSATGPTAPGASPSPAGNTLKAYGRDWAHFTRWCRMTGTEPLPPSPAVVGRYLAELAAPAGPAPALTATTIERRLFGLAWSYARRGFDLDRGSPPIVTALDEIRRRDTRSPVRKQAIRSGEIAAMAATLPYDLRGLRDRAMLLLGYAGALRRSEIVGLDLRRSAAPGSGGWVEIDGQGARLRLLSRNGPREILIGRASTDQSCPVRALEQWLDFARITSGPIFVRISRDGQRALDRRLSDKHVARLIKQTVLAAGLRAELPEQERLALFSGQSLRAGAP